MNIFDNLQYHIIKNSIALHELVDTHNQNLWDLVSSRYCISFAIWKQSTYGAFMNESGVLMLIPENYSNKGLFTHELLHFKLRIEGIDISNALNTLFYIYNNLIPIFEGENFTFTHNFLEHISIFDEFLNLGYNEMDFVSDYNDDKFNDIVETYLSDYLKDNGIYNAKALGFYISKYIGLRASRNKKDNFTRVYDLMKDIEPELFDICKTFIDEYEYISKLGYSRLQKEYASLLAVFVSQLSEWSTIRIIN